MMEEIFRAATSLGCNRRSVATCHPSIVGRLKEFGAIRQARGGRYFLFLDASTLLWLNPTDYLREGQMLIEKESGTGAGALLQDL